MDIVQFRISYSYIRSRSRLTWRELHFGMMNELVHPFAPVELAVDRVAEESEPSEPLLELAGARKDEPTMALVERLAASEPARPERELRDKWLYLVLAWLYDHRGEFRDLLRVLEEVHADFGYPQQMSGFAPNMPMQGPDLGPEANLWRFLRRWKKYIDEAAKAYAS